MSGHPPILIPNRGAHILCRCRVIDVVEKIKEKLDQTNLNRFQNSCFGMYLHLPDVKFQGQLLFHLLTHMADDRANATLRFLFINCEAVFGPVQYFQMTGLSFAATTAIPTTSRFHQEAFGSANPIYIGNIESAFNNECARSNGGSELALKLALVYFVYGVLFNTETKFKNPINLRYMHAVDDLVYFNSYPWGLDSYNFMLEHMYMCFDRVASQLARGRRASFELIGFTTPLQAWVYECFPVVAYTYSQLVDGHRVLWPRILRRRSLTTPTFGSLLEWFHPGAAIRYLPIVPKPDELEWIGLACSHPMRLRNGEDVNGVDLVAPSHEEPNSSDPPTSGDINGTKRKLPAVGNATNQAIPNMNEGRKSAEDPISTHPPMAAQLNGVNCNMEPKGSVCNNIFPNEHSILPQRLASSPIQLLASLMAALPDEAEIASMKDSCGCGVDKFARATLQTVVQVIKQIVDVTIPKKQPTDFNDSTPYLLNAITHPKTTIGQVQSAAAKVNACSSSQKPSLSEFRLRDEPLGDTDFTHIVHDSPMYSNTDLGTTTTPLMCMDMVKKYAFIVASAEDRSLYDYLEQDDHKLLPEQSLKGKSKISDVGATLAFYLPPMKKRLSFSEEGSSSSLAMHTMWDPLKEVNQYDLNEVKTWHQAGTALNDHRYFNVPLYIISRIHSSWFDTIIKHTEWLTNENCEAIQAMIMFKATEQPELFLQNWGSLDLLAWSKLERNNEDMLETYKDMFPYVHGVQPIQRPTPWANVDHLYGIAHVLGMHWVAYEVDFIHERIIVFDSLHSEITWPSVKAEFHNVSRFLPWVCQKMDLYASKRVVQQLFDQWTVEFYEKTPQQGNGCDCGIMALKFIECLACGYPVEGMKGRQGPVYRESYCAQMWRIRSRD